MNGPEAVSITLHFKGVIIGPCCSISSTISYVRNHRNFLIGRLRNISSSRSRLHPLKLTDSLYFPRRQILDICFTSTRSEVRFLEELISIGLHPRKARKIILDLPN